MNDEHWQKRGKRFWLGLWNTQWMISRGNLRRLMEDNKGQELWQKIWICRDQQHRDYQKTGAHIRLSDYERPLGRYGRERTENSDSYEIKPL